GGRRRSRGRRCGSVGRSSTERHRASRLGGGAGGNREAGEEHEGGEAGSTKAHGARFSDDLIAGSDLSLLTSIRVVPLQRCSLEDGRPDVPPCYPHGGEGVTHHNGGRAEA